MAPSGGYYLSAGTSVYRVDSAGALTRIAGGNDAPGFSGDGGLATNAQLNYPDGLAVDAAGDLIIADSGNNRVRKVSPSGVITTVAGTGTQGFSGDSGPATSAQLNAPSGLAVDGAGDLFIADESNHRVRKMTPAGTISTVAGTGTAGFAGDGGPATSAQLNYPSGVAVDAAGDVLIADYYNQRVRKVSSAGVISTVAGTGTAGFSGDGGPATSAQLSWPVGLAVDATGDLFIAEWGNHRVRKVTPNGVVSTVAGTGASGFSGDGGPATSAQLNYPSGVAVDAAGNLLIPDSSNYRVRKVTPAGVISTVAGNGTYGFFGDGGPATSAQLASPDGVAVDSAGDLFIADQWNQRVRKVTPAGVISTVAGNGTRGFSGDGGPATNAQLNRPAGLAVDAAGNLFIADIWNHRVRKVAPTGMISTVAGTGFPDFSGDGGSATNAHLAWPSGLAVDGAGDLFIADGGNNRVRMVSPAGVISTVAGNGTQGFGGDGGPAINAQVDPAGVAVDLAGDLIIADGGNNRVRMVSPAGVISTVAGNGTQGFGGDGGPAISAQLNYPSAVAVNGSGNLVIADNGNARVRIVNPAGVISTVAGTGTAEFSGDGGAATSAQLNLPSGVAVDGSGDLFIADWGNNRVRVVARAVPPPPVVSGGTYSPVTPARVLDSRSGVGGYSTRWGAGVSRDVAVTGVGGVPGNATAVVVNVTVTNPSDTSYLTVFPAGVGQPAASNLNFVAGQTVPNLVKVGVGAGGRVSIFNDRGSVDVLADVVGYYAPSGGSVYSPVTPARVLDSRSGVGGYSTRWGPATSRAVTVTGRGGVPANATAVVVNVTVTNPSDTSYLTVFPAGVGQPAASNLNFVAGQTVPNLVIVGVGANGQINIANDRGTVDVIADVVGYYTP